MLNLARLADFRNEEDGGAVREVAAAPATMASSALDVAHMFGSISEVTPCSLPEFSQDTTSLNKIAGPRLQARALPVRADQVCTLLLRHFFPILDKNPDRAEQAWFMIVIFSHIFLWGV